jgi:ribonucleoside-diphosphate reductase alpha chain
VLEQLKKEGLAPQWMQEPGYVTLTKGYLRDGENPVDMYRRLARTAAAYYPDSDLEEEFFNILWKGWLCPATPVAANFGTDKGLPISCYSTHVGDSLDSILTKNHELGMLAKHGGGVGIYGGELRHRGAEVKGTGGKSDGVVAWTKIYDSTVHSVSQGATRRGAAVMYLPVDHPDIEEFLSIRKPTGDANTRCFNINIGVVVSDAFMQSLIDGDKKNRKLWEKILTERFETGEPYIMFADAANRDIPKGYIDNGLKVSTSNLCTEIFLHTDPEHTFVCCLSSLNLSKWHEWKDTNTVQLAIYFLEAVMQAFIDKAQHIVGLESAVRFATKSRALGLGVLGWHTLLQQESIPFDGFEAMMLNSKVFKTIHDRSIEASKELAVLLGEPEWCKGTGMRHSHLRAIAPTVSNSTIAGDVSAGIEPWAANVFVQNSAKGTFVRRNVVLEKLLAEKGQNTPEVWSQINKDNGSVQNLSFLTDHEKEVFLTAREINQFAIVRQAAARQRWIDQGQSVNLFFGANSDPKYVHQVHLEAWQGGMKSLYYCRAESVLRADLASRQSSECKACEG